MEYKTYIRPGCLGGGWEGLFFVFVERFVLILQLESSSVHCFSTGKH